MSDSDAKSGAVLELAEEFLERYRKGERPPLKEYTDRFPDLADEIRDVFPAMAMMEKIALSEDGVDGGAMAGPRGKLPFAQLGDFRLIREVGRGGMGVVYEAEQVSLGRHVALKVLPQQIRDAKQRIRFEREAKATAKLHHTNIVPVFGVGEQDGQPYYVMQFIQGLGLDAVMDELQRLQPGAECTPSGRPTAGEIRVSRRDVSAADVARSLLTGAFQHATSSAQDAIGPDPQRPFAATQDSPDAEPRAAIASPSVATHSTRLSDSFTVSSSSLTLPAASSSGYKTSAKKQNYWQSVASIGRQVADALDYAHKQGILHRDIKPSNLLLDLRGTVWVTDFGLAKVAGPDAENLTHTGDVLGTLRYMPPEAFEGRTDARGDVYSLGLTMYELLAMRPAFAERDRHKLIKQVTTGERPALDKVNREVPRDLVTIVHKAIAREPGRRYATAEDFASDLQRFIDDEPILARRQTAVEAVWRWARQHRTVASLAAVVMILLVAIAGGAIVAAAYFRNQEREQRGLVQTKVALAERNQRLAEENSAAKKTAEDAQNRAEITLVDMQTSRGLMAAARDDPARAVLWFSKAAENGTADPERQADNRLRARNWARKLTIPVRAFPMASVSLMEFRPGGDLLLLMSDGHLFVRDWRQDKYLAWCNEVPQVGTACWSPDGEWLAIGYQSGVVQIRGVPDGRILQEVKSEGAITALAFSPNGKYLAIAGSAVRILGVSSRTLLPGEWKHPQPVHSMLFNRAGNRLITACIDRKVRVFAVPGGPQQWAPLYEPLPHQPRYASPPVLVENERRLITLSSYSDGGRPTELTCWDLETGKPAGPGVIRARPSHAMGVVASPRGDWFATVGMSGPEVWKTADNGTTSIHFTGHTGLVDQMVVSPDGRTLLSVSWDSTARFWSIPDGKPVGSPLPHMGIVSRCAIASDNTHLATLGDGLIRIWQRSIGGIAEVRPTNWQGIVRPSFNGQWIAPGIWHEKPYSFSPIGSAGFFVIDASTGTAAGPEIALHGALIDSCVGADNRTVAAVSLENGNGWLALNDVLTGKTIAAPQRLPGPPRSVAARPSSTQVAVLCAGGELIVFDNRNGKQILNLMLEGQSAEGRISRLDYTADGSTLVSLASGSDNIVTIRDAETGRLRCPPIHPVLEGGPCRSFALSSDSRLLATAVNGKNAAQVWDLATGRALSKPLPHPGDHYGLFCVCFSPDGRRLLTGGTDGQARLWDWRAGTLACPPLKHDDQVLSVAMTPDGRFALTTGRLLASQLHVWDLTTGKLIAPKIQLPIHATAALAISPNQLRVVASSSFVDSLARIELAKLLTVPEIPIDDYRLLGELASGQRIDQGDESGLTKDQWLQRLNSFNQRRPEFGQRGIAASIAFHRKAAQTLLETNQPMSAIAHYREALLEIGRAGGDTLGDRSLRAAILQDRAVAFTRLGRTEAATADFDRAQELDPKLTTSPETLAALGNAAADQRDWPKAASYFARAKDVSPDNWRTWHPYLLLCLQRQDAGSYQRACLELLRRFGQTENGVLANNIAWSCARSRRRRRLFGAGWSCSEGSQPVSPLGASEHTRNRPLSGSKIRPGSRATQCRNEGKPIGRHRLGLGRHGDGPPPARPQGRGPKVAEKDG